MYERVRKQLEALSPGERAKAEAMLANYRTPEYLDAEAAVRETLDREYAETGTIAVSRDAIPPEDLASFRQFIGRLRATREAKGMSLDDVALLSGLERSAISKLELGTNPNPTVRTITRYAKAVGTSLVWGFEPVTGAATPR